MGELAENIQYHRIIPFAFHSQFLRTLGALPTMYIVDSTNLPLILETIIYGFSYFLPTKSLRICITNIFLHFRLDAQAYKLVEFTKC